ncbi:histidine kinase [Spirillospora sp. NPDC047279]|uniref:sensor histidine kinase n=1 Tax=Spirillospora sp. NPDC047279 TaxID=3155478 RepID=UPI0033E57DDB
MTEHTRRPRLMTALDIAAAVLLGLVQILIAGNLLKDSPAFAFDFMVACLSATALAATVVIRRRWPFRALIAALAVWVVAYVTGALWGAYVAVALALYMVTVSEPARRSLRALALTAAAAPAVVATDPFHGWEAALWGTVTAWVLMAATWLTGRWVRARRAAAVRAERDRAQQIVVAERLRIARELHDVVTHGMGLIAVKASIANYIADSRPEEAREALRVIETTSKDALAEMRRLLGVLRSPGEAGLAPSPGVAALPELAERVADAGVRVRLTIDDAHDLPEAVQLATYRIVQEAVTNVVKHAAPAHCRVTVAGGAEGVRIEVTDDGTPSSAAPGSGSGSGSGPGAGAGGHGLVGIRERVAMYGGDFAAGPRAEGGFRVTATLPYRREAA